MHVMSQYTSTSSVVQCRPVVPKVKWAVRNSRGTVKQKWVVGGR